uniref:Uncharacterized protein n=1 Tax=Romanomermis culicivorax TaxID=13658 RepID=A0A915L8J6_ROMCU
MAQWPALMPFNIRWHPISYLHVLMVADFLRKFQQDLGHLPLSGCYYPCPHIGKANYLCQILAQDPKLPGINGIDAKFICNPPHTFNKWKKEVKDQFDTCQNGNPARKNPIMAVLQICHASGTVIIFEFYSMGLVPTAILNLLHTAH